MMTMVMMINVMMMMMMKKRVSTSAGGAGYSTDMSRCLAVDPTNLVQVQIQTSKIQMRYNTNKETN